MRIFYRVVEGAVAGLVEERKLAEATSNLRKRRNLSGSQLEAQRKRRRRVEAGVACSGQKSGTRRSPYSVRCTHTHTQRNLYPQTQVQVWVQVYPQVSHLNHLIY